MQFLVTSNIFGIFLFVMGVSGLMSFHQSSNKDKLLDLVLDQALITYSKPVFVEF